MDSFGKKRESIKMLMDMLKKSASDEVQQHGLPQTTPMGAKPEAGQHMAPDMQKQTKGTMPHPHMVDLTKTNPLQQKTSDSSMMADGGLVGTDMSMSDEPNRELGPLPPEDVSNPALSILPEAPQDEQGHEDERQNLHNEDLEHEDEDNNSSSFQGFFPRKKK